MNWLVAIILCVTLNTPCEVVTHPNGTQDLSIQCVQCGDWYIPMTLQQRTCPCDYDE